MNDINTRGLAELLSQHMENLTLLQVVSNLLVAFLCTIVIYAVYVFTSKDTKPTAAFAKTILIVTLSTSLLIMLVGSNLALSLGMIGAFSIIRFRAAVKDSRDAAFIFYAIAIGMTTALGVYALSLIGTFFIGVTVIVFSFLNIGSRTYVFTVKTYSDALIVEEEIKKKVGKRFSIIAITSKYDEENSNTFTELVYEIGLKEGAGELSSRLLGKEGVASVNAVLREDA
jgi:hypothetical protein